MRWTFPLILASLVAAGLATNNCGSLNLLPMPQNCTMAAEENAVVIQDPCSILYKLVAVPTEHQPHYHELLDHFQKKTFGCAGANELHIAASEEMLSKRIEYSVRITNADHSLRSVFTKQEEAYTLKAEKDHAEITAKTYVGVVRAVETLLQMFQCQRFRNLLTRRSCNLTHLPIEITDQPDFSYRGIMIDTARHYLPFHMILETIDALMYNKLNVLHWHITDQDSFPLVLRRHPEIAEYASHEPDQVYTVEQAKEVVRYAMVRGIRVVPELDTPGHAASWGRAPANSAVACSPGHYMGPLDVTLDATYTLIKEVFSEIIEIFPDPVLHLGGDEVALRCMVNRTQLMAAERDQLKGGTAGDFELYYRRRQHKIIKELDPKKTPIYWMNNNNIQIEQGDLIHWWGGTNIPKVDNKIVASFYGQYYLDLGVGNYLGSPYGSYFTWMDYFNQNSLKHLIANSPSKDNVIGAVVCLWSEMSNRYTHHPKMWIRSSAFAERVWNSNDENRVKPEGLRRVTAHERLMNRRGIPTAPATCQQCETSPQFC